MKKLNKKAQMEIIGLVIIVILISIGMLFYLRFGRTDNGVDYKRDFFQKELTVSTLNSLLQTRTSCPGHDMKKVIKDVVEGYDDEICGENKEDFLIEALNNTIMKETLLEWGKEYKLTIATSLDPSIGEGSYFLPNKIKSSDFDEKCSNRRKDSSLFFLSRDTGNGKIYITLEVCSSY